MSDSKQTLKECLGFWRDAVQEYNKGNHQDALNIFRQVDDPSSRVLYNIACAHIQVQQHDVAIECLSRAIQKDKHLAVAFFQRGTLHLRNHSIKQALEDLQTTKTLLRDNTCIDYKQLGMFCRLHKCEVLYNIAIARCLDNDVTVAKQLLTEGLHDADDRQRKLLTTAIDTIQIGRIDLLAPVYISIKHIFAPPKGMTSAFEKKNLVGKAKVVSATDVNDRDVWNGAKRAEELKQLNQCPLLSPKSPIMKIKHKLMNRYERRNKTFDEVKPEDYSSRTRCHSAGDLRILATSEANNLSKSTSQIQLFKNSALTGQLNSKRPSLGNQEITRELKDANQNVYTKKTGIKSAICRSIQSLTDILQSKTNKIENEQKSTNLKAEIEKCSRRKQNSPEVAHKHNEDMTRPPPPSYPPPLLPPIIIQTL